MQNPETIQQRECIIKKKTEEEIDKILYSLQSICNKLPKEQTYKRGSL